VVAARIAAQAVAEERAAVPELTSAAVLAVEQACDAVVAAAAALRQNLTAEIRALAESKSTALEDEQRIRDSQLENTRTSTSGTLDAAATLGDVDSVVHADAILQRVTVSKHAVMSMPAAPQTRARIDVSTAGLAAALAAVQRVAQIQYDNGGAAPPTPSTLSPSVTGATTTGRAGQVASAAAVPTAVAAAAPRALPLPPITLAAATAAQHSPVVFGRVSGDDCFTDMVASKASAALADQLDALRAEVTSMKKQTPQQEALASNVSALHGALSQVKAELVSLASLARQAPLASDFAALRDAVPQIGASLGAKLTALESEHSRLKTQVDRMPQFEGPLLSAVKANDATAVKRHLESTGGWFTEEVGPVSHRVLHAS
jgi:hypothetical protein